VLTGVSHPLSELTATLWIVAAVMAGIVWRAGGVWGAGLGALAGLSAASGCLAVVLARLFAER
jgi:hypothetical protein